MMFLKKFERGESSMSAKILAMLRQDVLHALSILEETKKAVAKSPDDLAQAKRMLAAVLANGNASGKEISELEAYVASKERFSNEKDKYLKLAETLVEDACAELVDYVIDICVPEEHRKDAIVDYISGNVTADVFWGKDQENHCVLDLRTKKIKHIKTQP